MRLPDQGTEQTAVLPPPATAYPAYGGAYPSYGDPPPPPPPTYAPVEPPPMPPAPPKERSYLGILTVSVMLVVLGGLAVADLAGAEITPPVYVVSALGVVAAGLVLGAWVGRSRGLIALGIVLGFSLGPVAVVNGVTDGDWQRWDSADDVRVQPLVESDLAPSYDYDAGSVRLDLTELAVDDTTDLATMIDLGAGEVVVIVPRDLDVTVSASTGAGEVEVLERRTSGFDADESFTDLGDDGAGGGSLDLTIDVGLGRVEVRRAAA